MYSRVLGLILENRKTLIALGAALLAGFLVILLVSKNPIDTFTAFITGPLGRVNRFGDWIEESITLTFLGLAVALVFRAEQFSLGAEGQLTLGALAAGVVALFVPAPPYIRIPLALIASMAAGFLFGMIPGVLKAKMNANEIVSTLMLNTIAVKFYEIVVTYFLTPQGAGFAASKPFPKEGLMPFFLPLPANHILRQQTSITWAIYLAIFLAFLLWFFMFRTSWGYELRISGLNRHFARYGGLNVSRSIILSMALSGAVAGLAGAHISLALHERLLLGVSVGIGFEGVVVALLARNHPLLVPFAALAYSYIRIGADVMERSSDVSREIVVIIQGIIILAITAERTLPLFRKKLKAEKEVRPWMP